MLDGRNESYCLCASPVGVLKIERVEQGISAVRFLGENTISEMEYTDPMHPLLQQAVRELGEYFSGRRQVFTLPLALEGTPFQHRVWEALKTLAQDYRLPIYLFYFQELSTQEIAKALSIRPGAVRMRLTRGREQLREKLKGAYFDE